MSLMYRGVSSRADRSRARLGDVLWAFVLIFATATILVASRPATATNGAVLTLATERQQLSVARSDVVALRVAPMPNGRATLHILLTAEAASALSQFTRAQRGADMRLEAPGEVIAVTKLARPIDGGYLGVHLANPVRARRIAKLITGAGG